MVTKDEKQAFSDRFNAILDKAGIPQKGKGRQGIVAKMFGVSDKGARKWIEGESIPQTTKLPSIIEKFKDTGVTAEWLLTGNPAYSPENYIGDNELPSPPPNYVLGELELWDGSTPLRDDEVALPYFREVELAAGSGRHEVIENHGMKLRFAKSTLKNQDVLECNAACATVSGNSMEPKLHNGTAIGIDKGTTNIIDGEMYAIDHDGSLRVKYLYKMPGGALRLRSENREEWPDETLSFEEAKSVKVIGWVFWWSTLPKRRYA